MPIPFPKATTLSLLLTDRANVRFALSPLWECVAAFRQAMDPACPPVFHPWVRRARSAISGIDWSPLSAVALMPRGSIPDFLTPPPASPLPTLADELDTVKRSPENVVRTEVAIAYGGNIPPLLEMALRRPASLVQRLTALLEQFWHRAIEPEWALLRSKLEGEVLFRARTLALDGLEGLFRGLHRDVSYDGQRLTVGTHSYWDGKERKRGLLLLPSIFGWPHVFLTVRPPWQPAVIYPARGIADLWGGQDHSTPAGLSRLVGHSCAKVMAKLQVPQTTLETAAALKLSTAATSEQITGLWRAGILERTRVGKRVFYCLNEKGRAIFTTFDC